VTNTVGRVDFTARLDGRRTPKDAENIGRKMGAEASDGFDETWSKGFKDTLAKSGQDAFARWEKNGRSSGGVYGKAFTDRFSVYLKDAEKNFASLRLDPGFLDGLNEKFDDAGLAAGHLQRQLVTLRDEGILNASAFKAAQRQVDDWANSQKIAAIRANDTADALDRHNFQVKKFEDELAASMKALDTYNDTTRKSKVDLDLWGGVLDKATTSITKNKDATDGMNLSWGKIPHNGRQAIVWTAAIVSAMEQMATLGSAAGAGLLIVGGAATQALVGGGALFAVFQGLGGELEELPEAVRPAAEAFQGLGDSFGILQDAIQVGALDNAAGAFERIGTAVEQLAPAFTPLSDVIGGLIDSFSEWAEAATLPGGNVFELVEQSAPTFDTLMRTVGKFGDTLLDAFTDPTMQRGIQGLVGWIDDLVDGFDEFVNSPAFGSWIDNGIRIFESLGGLLEGIATTLNNLVTPDSVDRTIRFLDALTGSMPLFEGLLTTLGGLDVFGIIATALETLGIALAPLFAVLEPIATIIGNVLIGALQGLGAALEFLSPLFLPIQIGMGLISAVAQPMIEWFTKMTEELGIVGGSISDVTGKIMEALNPAFEAISDAITTMLPSPEEFATFLNDTLVPAIEDVADWIQSDLVPAIEDFATWINDTAIPAAEDFADFFNEEIGPVIEDVAEWLGDSADDFRVWAGVVSGVMKSLLGPIGWAIDAFNNLFGAANTANNAARSGGGGGGGFVRPMARGGVLYGPTHVLAGEAGREAFVPLDRPLSQVDESVRWLAAIARGQSGVNHMATGGIAGASGTQIIISEGAIVVNDRSGDPRRTGNEVLQRFAEDVMG